MTLKECYGALGGDYEEVLGRLTSERLVQKFALKFLNDPSFGDLQRTMAAHDREEAFRAAHTIKGVSQNLSFTRLYHSSALLADALRNEWAPEAEDLAAQVAQDYQVTVEALRAYQACLPA